MAQFILFILLLCSQTWGKVQYTLTDLEVLAQEGGHDEFFTHALDVRPSERQDAWKGMVAKMADAFTRGALNGQEIRTADFRKLEDLWKWPALRTDDVFKARRQEMGLRYLRQCLKGSDPCWKELEAFWEADRSDPDTAFKLAELVSTVKDSPLPLWTFLEVALKSPLSEFYCKKEFSLKALWSRLEVDYVRLGPQGDLMKKIDATVHPDCLPALIQEARSRLLSPEKQGDRELGHQILASQLKADQKTSDFFHVVYLLETPSQGELFNYSWNRLKELGNSSTRRETVMSMVRDLDPLPDTILTSFDLTKKRVILSHFKRHFPEYLDHYANQCVLFYGGKTSFPKGNPTMNCQDLMKSDLAPALLDPLKVKEYHNVRKI